MSFKKGDNVICNKNGSIVGTVVRTFAIDSDYSIAVQFGNNNLWDWYSQDGYKIGDERNEKNRLRKLTENI